MLTLSTSWFASVHLVVGALTAWSCSNLWRAGCAVLFKVFYREQLTWEESQNMVLIANCKSQLDGALASGKLLFHRRKMPPTPQRSRANVTLIAACIVGCVTLGLGYGLPLLIALIPTTRYGLITPHECGLTATAFVSSITAFNDFSAKLSQLADAGFAVVDGNQFKSNWDSSLASASLPAVTTSFVSNCPPNVSACSSEYPFTFSANYTLYREHFALNVDIPFSLQVIDTCYRLTQATAPLNSSNPDVHEVGYFYGPLNTFGDIQNYTDTEDTDTRFVPGYRMSQHFALANPKPEHMAGWTPNSTIVMGGDTTLLLYRVAGVLMTEQSSDPLFATEATPAASTSTPLGQVESFLPADTVVPIACDTKYVLCADDRGDCSPLGGRNDVLDWTLRKLGAGAGVFWEDIGLFLSATLSAPPIYQTSLGSTAIIASETTSGGGSQFLPHNVTAQRELSRLVEAGMLMLASYMQLSAVGYWNTGNGTEGFTHEGSLCTKVVTEFPKLITIPVIPYILVVVTLVLVVLMGRAKSFLPRRMWSPAHRNLFDAWVLHSAGQLHREVTERIHGGMEKVDTVTDWPTVRTFHSGPKIETYCDTKRFA
jgi:hypothetical protein